MLIKTVGAVLIMTSGLFIGISLNKRLTDRVLELKEAADFLVYVKRMIDYEMPLLSDLFSQYDRERTGSVIKTTAVYLKTDYSYEASVHKAFEAAEYSSVLDRKDRDYLCSLFLQLGSSDRESQITLIENALRQIECMTKKAEREKESKSKVYMSVAVYSGAALAILML